MTRLSQWLRRHWAWLLLALFVAFTFRFLFVGYLQSARDLFRLFIPESAYLRERLLAGELPLWNPYARLGQPFLGTLYTQVLYPPRVVLVLLFGPAWGMNLLILFHAALASSGAYLAARRLRAPPSAALIAGLFGVTPMFNRLGEAQHVCSAAAWSGFIVIGALELMKRPGLRAAAILAVPTGLSWLCGAPEMALWQGLLVLAIAAFSRSRRRALPWASVALGWGALLAAAVIVPAAELIFIWRGAGDTPENHLAWSASLPQLLSMGWLFADEKRDLYWGGDQWFVTSLFIGALPCALAVLSLRRRALRLWPFAAVATLCATLALGSHFVVARVLLKLPPFSFFRYPTKYAVGLAFVIFMLAPFGMRRVAVWARRIEPTARSTAQWLAAGLALTVATVAVAALPYWRSGVRTGALYFGVCCLLGLALFCLVRPGLKRSAQVRLGLMVLALGESAVAQVFVPFVGLTTVDNIEKSSALAQAIRDSGPVGRISVVHQHQDLPQQRQATTLSFTEEAEAFVLGSRDNLVPLRWYEEQLTAVEGYGFRDPDRLAAATEDEPRGSYDVFGVTHYVRTAAAPFSDLTLVGTSSWARAYRSSTAFDRAWLVTKSQIVDERTALTALRENPTLLKHTALLPRGPVLDAPPCDSRTLITEARPERLTVQADACAQALLVVSDAAYPGWQATVDGSPAQLWRADFMLKAVEVPQGRHEVVLQYRPPSFAAGAAISALSWLAVAAALRFGRKRSKK